MSFVGADTNRSWENYENTPEGLPLAFTYVTHELPVFFYFLSSSRNSAAFRVFAVGVRTRV